jgi:hypothetical protein
LEGNNRRRSRVLSASSTTNGGVTMPLFVIPIIAGALVVGATTVDVSGDKQEVRAQAQGYTQQQQHQAFASMADCQQWAAQNGRSAANCQQR